MTTSQAIFDHVTQHLFKQGIAAIDPQIGNCAYRTSDGLTCAVGCLLDDETYEKRFEGYSLGSMFDEYEPQTLPALFREHYSLLSALQGLHDNAMPRYKIADDTHQSDVDLYHSDMTDVAKELRLIAATTNLHFDESLVPERYRHAN